jgi:hypothetical protein
MYPRNLVNGDDERTSSCENHMFLMCHKLQAASVMVLQEGVRSRTMGEEGKSQWKSGPNDAGLQASRGQFRQEKKAYNLATDTSNKSRKVEVEANYQRKQENSLNEDVIEFSV